MYDSVWGLKLTVTKRPTSGHFLQFWSTTNWIWPPIWPNNIQSSQLPGHVRQNCRTFCLTNLKKLYRALVSQSKGHFTWFYSTSHKKISASLSPTPTPHVKKISDWILKKKYRISDRHEKVLVDLYKLLKLQFFER